VPEGYVFCGDFAAVGGRGAVDDDFFDCSHNFNLFSLA
jgi:hypothetical protein